MRRLGDPFVATCVLAGAIVAAGFALIGLGWRGVAGLVSVPLQIPYLMSGGVGGLALIGTGAALLAVQAGRHRRAVERRDLDEALDAAGELLEAARRSRR